MTFKEEIDRLLSIDSNLNKYDQYKITNNCYLIDGGRLCYDFKYGDTRFPYAVDGKTLWCHQNGNISLNESSLFTIREVLEGETNSLAFFLGINNGETYDFHSLFELNSTIFSKEVKRFTYFKDGYAIYLLKVKGIIYALRITLDFDKKLYYEVFIKNASTQKVSLYSSMFLNFMLMHSNGQSVETKWFKKCSYNQNDIFSLYTVEDISVKEHLENFAKLKRCYSKNDGIESLNTTSRRTYADSRANRIESSRSLVEGKLFDDKYVTNFSDTAICGDIIKFDLDANEELKIGYQLVNFANKNEHDLDTKNIAIDEIDNVFKNVNEKKENYYNNDYSLRFKFGESDFINSEKFNLFTNELIKQVDYCALTKNSTLIMLGVRDIFQAIEAGLIWNHQDARRKIIEALNFLTPYGRFPRQYSLPVNGVARIDDRNFIDQGLWVIDAVFQYLAYTNDYEFLNEICGYMNFDEKGSAFVLEEKDDVLSHIIKVVNFLTSNIDENTHCLKTLYGDWNDAINGLGASDDENHKFGNGVSIMASFQLYSVLEKLIKILNKVDKNKYATVIKFNEDKRRILALGLKENAFVSNEKGEHKIIHGWGNNKSFLVGSFNDVDKKERDTLTSNAFYILSGYYKENGEYVNDVLKAYDRLDSKYGYKTFDPFFDKDAWKVGRIVNLPKGTAENAATYIHATVFALDSLFMLNKDEEAWKQIYKIIPITHEYVTSTPFVMPNSYIYNPELDCDGESMNDWFTGSSSTLLKSLVKNAFGMKVDLDEITFTLANYFPFKTAIMEVKPCKTKVLIKYIKTNSVKKLIKVNGQIYDDFEIVDNKRVIKFDKNSLKDKLEIEVEF